MYMSNGTYERSGSKLRTHPTDTDVTAWFSRKTQIY